MKTFLVKDKFLNTEIKYKNLIEPIKAGNEFLPNYAQLAKEGCFILKEDFERHQKNGRTIIVNMNGGWCLVDKDTEIIK